MSSHSRRHGDRDRDRYETTDPRYAASGYAGANSAAGYPGAAGYQGATGYPDSRTTGSSSGPVWRWWIPAEGISRDVIQADIQRYLGNEALVRPGYGTGEQEGVPGYYIAAYRNLTAAMLQDLKADSANWSIQQSQRGGRYEESQIHQSRHYWGPTGSTPGQQPAQPAQPSYGSTEQSYYGTAAAPRREEPYPPTGYTTSTTSDYRRTANPPPAPQSQSPENPYYVASPGASTGYSTATAYPAGYDPRDPRTADPRTADPRATRSGQSNEYPAGYTAASYAAPAATQQRQPRQGYYIASDGREYPISQMPTGHGSR